MNPKEQTIQALFAISPVVLILVLVVIAAFGGGV